jgi:hypothetical protein
MTCAARTTPLAAPETERRRRIAFHEAGHAVVAAWSRSTAFVVRIDERLTAEERRRGLLGVVEPLEAPPANAAPARLRGRELRAVLRLAGLDLYAGVAAEFPRASAGALALAAWTSGGGDFEELVRVARRHGCRRPPFHAPSLRRAQRFVDAVWGQVEAVAAALFEAGELTGEAVRRLVVAAPDRVNRRPAW